jgi:hypothetical protein
MPSRAGNQGYVNLRVVETLLAGIYSVDDYRLQKRLRL